MYKLFKQDEDSSWALVENADFSACDDKDNADEIAVSIAEGLCNGVQYRVEKVTEIGTTILNNLDL